MVKQLKDVYYSLYDSNGNERIYPTGIIRDRNLSNARIRLLKQILDLVLNTSIVSEYSKEYIKNKDITMASVVDRHNERMKTQGEPKSKFVTKDYVVSRIEYDNGKLEAIYGKSVLSDIMFTMENDLSKYQLETRKQISKYRQENSLNVNNLMIRVGKDYVTDEFEGNFFDIYGSILKIFLKSTFDKVQEQLDADSRFQGYFNYLISGIDDDREEIVRDREELKKILEGNFKINEIFEENSPIVNQMFNRTEEKKSDFEKLLEPSNSNVFSQFDTTFEEKNGDNNDTEESDDIEAELLKAVQDLEEESNQELEHSDNEGNSGDSNENDNNSDSYRLQF